MPAIWASTLISPKEGALRRKRRKNLKPEQEAAESFTLPARLTEGRPTAGLMAMQHNAGNQAVNQMLASELSLLSPNIPAPTINRIGNSIVATFYFGQNQFLLDNRNLAAVEKLTEELRFMLNPALAVEGYASAEGTEATNLNLSENRRQTVLALLRSQLKEGATFGGAAHGEALAADEETIKAGAELEQQRARHRNVTVVVLPTTMPKAEAPPKPIGIPTLPPPKPETDNERLQRELREAIKRGPLPQRPQTSFNEAFWKVIDENVEAISRQVGVPEKYRGKVRAAAHALLEKGAEKIFDQAMSESHLNEQQKDAIKAAIKAAAQTKFDK